MKKDSELIYNTSEVIEKLGAIYCSPTYALLTQVRNGTGYARNARTADAIYMSLWPSRGIYLAGIEVKVSRTDWLKELGSPEKAEDIAQYCDYWYLAVGDASIVKEGELPVTWGLIVPDKKNGMRVIKEASKLKPKPIDNLLLASIMRNVTERSIPKDLIEKTLKEKYDRGVEWGKDQGKDALKKYEELLGEVQKFEKIAGIKISAWGGNEETARAIKAVMEGKHLKAEKEVLQIRQTALNIAKFIDGELERYEI